MRTVLMPAPTPGVHLVSWDTPDGDGALIPAGVYDLEMRADGWEGKERLVIIR